MFTAIARKIISSKSRNFWRVTASAFIILQTISPLAALPAFAARPTDNPKVEICHRDNNVKKPYGPKKIEVDQSAVDGGGTEDHSSHTGSVATSEAFAQTLKDAHENWGDIIPPFDGFAGYNWTTEGQAIWNNDCQYVEALEEEESATLTVRKIVEGGEAEASVFTIHVLSEGADVAGSPQAGSEAGAEYELTPGTYTVSEVAHDDYTSSIECDGPGTDTIALVAGDDKECIVANTFVEEEVEDESVNICHNTSSNQNPIEAIRVNLSAFDGIGDNDHTSHGDFLYDGPTNQQNGQPTDDDWCNTTITLLKEVTNDNDGDASAEDFDLSVGEQTVHSGDTVAVPADEQIEINEAGLEGYHFVSIAGDGCPETLGESVTLEQGEDITCTITNDDDAPPPPPLGSLTIVKDANPNNSQDFQFATSLEEEFALDDDDDSTLSNLKQFELAPDVYYFAEYPVEGWEVESISCDTEAHLVIEEDGIKYLLVLIEDGDDITCTFVNVPEEQTRVLGSITIIKDADPDDPQDFGFTSTELGNFDLDDDSDPTLSNSAHFSELTAGTYTITENAVNGWGLLEISCPKATVTIVGSAVTIELGEGEDVTCTFENRKAGLGSTDDDGDVLGDSTTIPSDTGDVLSAATELPRTGGLGTDALSLLFSMISGIVTFVWVDRRRRASA